MLVCGDTASEKDRFGREQLGGFFEFLNYDFDGCSLEASGEIGDLLLAKLFLKFVRWGGDGKIEFFLNGAKDGGLEAAKRKV